MATKRNNTFTPVFEGRTVRATVTGMRGNIVAVKFNKQKRINRAAVAAKQARVV